jgi:hypothetical protein
MPVDDMEIDKEEEKVKEMEEGEIDEEEEGETSSQNKITVHFISIWA